jgi:hypothetical protein
VLKNSVHGRSVKISAPVSGTIMEAKKYQEVSIGIRIKITYNEGDEIKQWLILKSS